MNPYQEILSRLDSIEKRVILSTKEVLTLQEAAIYTGLSESTLYKYNAVHKIPFSKPEGKSVYYEKKDLDAWMKKNRVESNEGIERIAMRTVQPLKRQAS